MSTQPARNPAGTADEPNTTDLYELAIALGVDASELRVFLTEASTVTTSRVLGWAQADPSEHYDRVEEYLDRRDHGRPPEVRP